MGKSERVRELLPMINRIQDEGLRGRVISVWVKAWEESKWEDLADAAFNLDVDVAECNLVKHTNLVTELAYAMASSARQVLNIMVDMDVLLAGGLLHDVSKLVEMAPEKGKPGKKSALGKNLLHSIYGVHLALNAGIPLEIVHIIGSHSPRVAQGPNGYEALFVSYADFVAADTVRMRAGTSLWLKKEQL